MARTIIKQSNLENVVARINRITNSPLATYTRTKEDKLIPNPGNFYLDYAYGGVSLRRLAETGGDVDILRLGRVSKRTLYDAMFAFIEGLEVGRAMNKNKIDFSVFNHNPFKNLRVKTFHGLAAHNK